MCVGYMQIHHLVWGTQAFARVLEPISPNTEGRLYVRRRSMNLDVVYFERRDTVFKCDPVPPSVLVFQWAGVQRKQRWRKGAWPEGILKLSFKWIQIKTNSLTPSGCTWAWENLLKSSHFNMGLFKWVVQGSKQDLDYGCGSRWMENLLLKLLKNHFEKWNEPQPEFSSLYTHFCYSVFSNQSKSHFQRSRLISLHGCSFWANDVSWERSLWSLKQHSQRNTSSLCESTCIVHFF